MRNRIYIVAMGCLTLWFLGCGSGKVSKGWLEDSDATIDGDVGADAVSPEDVDSPDVDTDRFDVGFDVRVEDADADMPGEDILTGEDVVAPPPDIVAPPDPPDTLDPPDPPDPVSTATFGTLHWNIAGGKENNCATAKIKRAVMRFVRDAPNRIDFISLNEVCPAQYTAIRGALKTYWNKNNSARFSAFQGSGGSRVGSAIFSRRNIEAITRDDVGEDQWGKRYLLCGRQVGRRIRVCTAHLSPADTKARRQLTRVITRIENWWSNRNASVIIGGDFNLLPNDAGLNAIYAAGTNTSNNPNNRGKYRELDDNDPNHCKGYGERSLPGSSGGPCNQGRKIDYIFVRANRLVNGTYRGDTLNIPNDCTGVCSDHRPVRGYANIKFRTD